MKIMKALEIYSLYKAMLGSQRKDNEMRSAIFTNISF